MSRPSPQAASSRRPLWLRATAGTAWDLLVVLGRILALLALLFIFLPVALVPLAVAGVLLVVAQLAVGVWGGHYRHLLTQRYLRRKLIPLFAAVAVALCTAMVVIVLSVMGGFIDMVRAAGQMLMADVSIEAGIDGFPHYRELMDEIEKLPEAAAATAGIDTYGLLKLPWGETRTVQVKGIDGRGLHQVTGFGDMLFWNRRTLEQNPDAARLYGPHDPYESAIAMQLPWGEPAGAVPIVPGIEVNPANYRTPEGKYESYHSILREPMTLTVVPITREGAIDEMARDTRQVVPINEFKSGLYDADSRQVYIPFDVAQQMMQMEEGQEIARNPDGSYVFENGEPKVIGTVPARASWVYVRAAEGVPLELLRDRVREIYARVYARHRKQMPPPDYISIATWEERQAQFLGAVENEKGLMAFMFSIISIVSIVMVGVIFYTIVTEKTRDIGVLRALGASQIGVASIFLTFGAVIGAMGTVIGCAVGYSFVVNINAIHDWLGDGFGAWATVFGGMSIGLLVGIIIVAVMFAIDAVTDRNLVSRHTLRRMLWIIGGCVLVGLIAPAGAMLIVDDLVERMNQTLSIVIWDRRVYIFERIPSRVDTTELIVIGVTAVIAAVVGALLPAVKAAMVDPVESLRYE